MKSRFYLLALLSVLLVACRDRNAENLKRLAPKDSADLIIVGISPGYTEAQGERFLRSFGKLLGRAKLGSNIMIFDALNCQRVTEFSIPADNPNLASERARGDAFAQQILDLRRFILGQADSSGHVAAIHVPRFLETVSQIASRTEGKTSVLIVGSALHQDSTGHWTFEDLSHPSDGVLLASPLENVFGTVGRESFLTGIDLHFVCWDEWETDAYRLAVHRFWHLYCQRQQEENPVGLLTFTSDLDEGIRRLLEPDVVPLWEFEIDEKSTSREMVPIPSQLPQVPDEPASLEEEAEHEADESVPPEGLARVGLRWKDEIDLDLYVETPGGKQLFYDRRKCDEAYFYKDERNAPKDSRGFEYVHFPQPVDPRTVKVWVNFYRGETSTSPEAELLFEFHGKWYKDTVTIESRGGNRGQDRQSDRSGSHWFGPINLKLPGS